MQICCCETETLSMSLTKEDWYTCNQWCPLASLFIFISTPNVCKELLFLGPEMSCIPDDLSLIDLNEFVVILFVIFYELFNKFLYNNEIPDFWRTAVIIPLYEGHFQVPSYCLYFSNFNCLRQIISPSAFILSKGF